MRLMSKSLISGVLLFTGIAAQAESAPAFADPKPPVMADANSIDAVLSGDWRSEKNRARDQYRHPRQTLEFFGVTPQMAVIEIWPGGGWYADVLAPLLRDAGSYAAALPAADDGDGQSATAKRNKQLRDRFSTRPEVFGKAHLIEVDAAAPVLGAPNSADAVLTFRNVHNWVMADQAPAMFKAMFEVLKPGGVLGVVDHRARADQPAEEMKTSGYLPESVVIELAQAAGFVLAAKSEINANEKDVKNYSEGVWTLPPTLALGDKDRDTYLAIGESDRMTLRFIKPAN